MIDVRRVLASTMLLLGLAATPALLASPPTPDPAASAPELARAPGDANATPVPVEARTAAIEAEIAALAKVEGGHPWAGRYYEGDGLGANVSFLVSPVAGAAVTWHGCLGLYGANEGTVSQRDDGTLDVAFNWKNEEGGFANFPSHLLPVRWGERSYLVPPDQLLAFVNAINRGIEPRERMHGGWYLRVADEERPVAGLPALPPEYLALIRAENVAFAVRDVVRLPDTGAKDLCQMHWRLTIDTNGDELLRVGTELEHAAPEGRYQTATIVELNPSTAVLESSDYGRGNGKCRPYRDTPQPDTTWRFATGYYPRERDD